jgi:eukaryotic-like serine/threonine-protein kinase
MSPQQKLEKIGRYQVLDRVGKGGMGVLYRGFDPVLDREVAIKLMHADFSEDTEQMRPRFYREARAAAKLNHRNIVTIFEFAEESNIPYIVMEFLRGTPLGARLNSQPPLTLDDKLNVVAQLCDGLSYAHEQGVVHRDVKPDNVFLLEDGSVKLLDFGIAKLTSSTLTRQGDVLGSASYMSPEQVGGSESVDGRADIFSTGVVLYELLSGRKPFEGDSPTSVIVKILKDNPTPIETVTTGLPPEVIAAVMKALQKDPADRFQTADAMGRELQSIRKALHPSMSKANMDETRFASTQVMKALHEDFQRSRATGDKVANDTKAGMPAAVGAEAGAQTTEAQKSRGWLVPAGIGVVVLVAVVGGFLLYSPGTPAAADPVASTKPAGVSTSAGAAPPASTESTPASTASTTPLPAATPPPPASAPPSATPAGGSARAGAGEGSAPAKPAAKPAAPPPPAAMVSVTLTGGYPFEVLDGTKSISAAAASHELKQPPGKTLQLRAPQYFLSQTVRVEGSVNQPFEFAVPGLGSLDVRSVQETCDVAIANKKLGNPPLVVKEIAAGSYKVDLVCGSDVVKSAYATVTAGKTSVAAIK